MDDWSAFESVFKDNFTDINIFMKGVDEYFSTHQSLNIGGHSVVHSTKRRIKDLDHLREKIERKRADGREITPKTLMDEVTDLAGVRLLLLFQQHFATVDAAVRRKVDAGDWVLKERPKAFTWDPEATQFFGKFDVDVLQRDTFYTSVYYLIKPRSDNPVCCELQVRTLFEEIWGEVDHMINYPQPTKITACKEQLMVLSKIVGAGSRLVDSIQRTIDG